MVLTRAQVDNLSREELIEELLKFSDITDKLNGLNNRFEDFIKKYDELHSELLISRNCNSLLLKRITNLERNALNNAQYVRRETIEINPIPQSIPNTDLENKVCLALSWLVRDSYTWRSSSWPSYEEQRESNCQVQG